MPTARTLEVNQNGIGASDNDDGKPFVTIRAAARLARAGDTVLVHAGIYRERVAPIHSGTPNAPITYRAADDETVIIKGSEIWQPEWRPVTGHIYEGKLNGEWLQEFNPFTVNCVRTFGNHHIGQVFVNGLLLREADHRQSLQRTPSSWMVDEKGARLTINFPEAIRDPQDACVEITVRRYVFAPSIRGLAYIKVQGLIIEHCANQLPSGFYHRNRAACNPQAGALSTRSGNHWTIEKCTIRYAAGLGLDCGYEGEYDLENQPSPDRATIGWHLIRNNVVSDNGCGGIAGAGAQYTQVIGNIFERNNYLKYTPPEIGAVKFHFFIGGLIEGNFFRDNDCYAVWLDNVYRHARVTRNICINNQKEGIFCEMGVGPCLVDNNIVAYTRNGAGIYIHDASGVTVSHNLLFANAHFGVYMRPVTERNVGAESGGRVPVGSSHQRVINNVFIDNYRGHISMALEDGQRTHDNRSDYNLFINGVFPHWEGLGLHKFNINNGNGFVRDEEIATALRRALEKHRVPAELQPNYELWQQTPYLSLDWWRKMTGNDVHSPAPLLSREKWEDGAVQEGAANFSCRTPYFEVRHDSLITQMQCPRDQGSEYDLFGAPRNTDHVFPGPFQHFKPGHNRFLLSIA
ncbi:MAG: right-handed parallel beta-helix repeat-containing protein [Chitinivibrionales bacterium]|nr:right-handed parallel beta-helix repeat-containing protein [Chitinivibrionales bacterium]